MSGIRPELTLALERRHPGMRLESLPGDASSRRFHRMFLADGSAQIIMDYGGPFEDETDDVRIARIFVAAGLPAAKIHEIHPVAGCLVLEDLGDLTLEAALAGTKSDPATRRRLYADAVALATDIAVRGTPALRASERSGGPALDRDRFSFEMGFFLENYVGRLLGRAPVGAELVAALEGLAAEVSRHPPVLCHRDYHSRNLMVPADKTLAMVDIQDARWGPDTYDIASLLRDAYVDLDEAEVRGLLDDYRRGLSGPPERETFERRFHLVGAQRMIKALGTFGYQIVVLGRERYRGAIPRTLERLRTQLPSEPETRQLGSLLHEAGVI